VRVGAGREGLGDALVAQAQNARVPALRAGDGRGIRSGNGGRDKVAYFGMPKTFSYGWRVTLRLYTYSYPQTNHLAHINNIM
jgi:hypothetical protein